MKESNSDLKKVSTCVFSSEYDLSHSYAWFYFWSESDKESFNERARARYLPFPALPEPIHRLPFYGTKDWANWVLTYCIEEIFNKERYFGARQLEIYGFIEELDRYGWKWQAERVRNWIHLGIKKGTFYAEGERLPIVEETSHKC